MIPANDDLIAVRPPVKDIELRYWPAGRRAAFEYLEPAALCLVASDGPVSITLWGRDGSTKRLGHNRGIWPAKLAKTTQVKDTVTANYNKGLFFIGTQFRIWCLGKAERDKLGMAVLELIADRAEEHGGLDELDNGFEDLGPDLDMSFFEMECHGIADRLGLVHWDDDGMERFLDRVDARVLALTGGKPVRDLRRIYERAAIEVIGR